MGVEAVNDSKRKQRQRGLDVVRSIRAGQAASYGEVARRTSLPGRTRLVARILAENDDPVMPWHWVVGSDGCLAFLFRKALQTSSSRAGGSRLKVWMCGRDVCEDRPGHWISWFGGRKHRI